MPSATINGFEHYWEDVGQGEQVLVMLHGAAGAGKSLVPVANELSRDLRVLVPDMRGMGHSQRVHPIPADAWVEDVRGLLDHLGIEQANVYGTSLGTRVALRFAIAYPERTRSVILENAIIAFEEAGNTAMNQRVGDPDNMAPATVARYESLHGADWKAPVRAYFAWRNDPAAHAYYDMRESSKSVTLPVLITRGDLREPVHPIAHSFELFQNMVNSHLWIKPEGGCFATPEGLQRVRDFIADPMKPSVSTAPA